MTFYNCYEVVYNVNWISLHRNRFCDKIKLANYCENIGRKEIGLHPIEVMLAISASFHKNYGCQ